MHKLTIIGGGNMAAAIASGLIASGMPPTAIEVVEIDAEARTRLAASLGVQVRADLKEASLHALIVLAVKPQSLPQVANILAPRLSQQLVLSIAAGVRISDLARWLGGYEQIVRAMPNTPAMVGAGMTGLYAQSGVDQDARSSAEAVMRSVGSVVWVAEETLLDAVTAVSGSGPAYVFYFIESLEAAAVAEGLSPASARQLALQTFFGAAKLESSAIKSAIAKAVAAARQRCITLGDELGKMT